MCCCIALQSVVLCLLCYVALQSVVLCCYPLRCVAIHCGVSAVLHCAALHCDPLCCIVDKFGISSILSVLKLYNNQPLSLADNLYTREQDKLNHP